MRMGSLVVSGILVARIASPDPNGKMGIYVYLHASCPFSGLAHGSVEMKQNEEILVGYCTRDERMYMRDGDELWGAAETMALSLSCSQCKISISVNRTILDKCLEVITAAFVEERRKRQAPYN